MAQARARDAETEKAKAEAVTRFLTETLAAVDPAQARGREVSVREALDAAAAKIDGDAMAGQPEVEAAVRRAIGTTYASLGLLDAAEKQLLASLDPQQRHGATPLQQSDTHRAAGRPVLREGQDRSGDRTRAGGAAASPREPGEKRPEVATALDNLGAVLMSRGDMTEAEPLLRQALAIRRELLPADDPQLAVSLNNLGFLTWRKGSLQEAEAMYRESLDIDRRKLGPDRPEVPTKLLNIAIVYRDQGRPEEGEPLAREAVAIRRKILGNRHPQLADAIERWRGSREDRGRNGEAETRCAKRWPSRGRPMARSAAARRGSSTTSDGCCPRKERMPTRSRCSAPPRSTFPRPTAPTTAAGGWPWPTSRTTSTAWATTAPRKRRRGHRSRPIARRQPIA